MADHDPSAEPNSPQGIDGVSRFLGMRWDSAERIATINISINYLRTARGGEVVCTSRVDRRNDRVAVLSSEVRDDDERLLATAIGSFSIFPKQRLAGHERRM